MSDDKKSARKKGGPTPLPCPTGDQLAALRGLAHMTQEEVAKDFFPKEWLVSPNTISSWERGKSRPGTSARIEFLATGFHEKKKLEFETLKKYGFPVELLLRLDIRPSQRTWENAPNPPCASSEPQSPEHRTSAPQPMNDSSFSDQHFEACILPTPLRTKLVGRTSELRTLTRSLNDRGGKKTNLVVIVGAGGEGKTTLIDHAIKKYRQKRGPALLKKPPLIWSFYNQGLRWEATKDSHSANASDFIAYGLREMSDSTPLSGTDVERAERLAALLSRNPRVVVLDGLEPLQRADSSRHDVGYITDPALRRFLCKVAASNSGLVIVTSRLAIAELSPTHHAVCYIHLTSLSRRAGAELLQSHGLQGTQDALERASVQCGNHALSLTLLAGYLKLCLQGDIRRIDTVTTLLQPANGGSHAERVMRSYEAWYRNNSFHNELGILYLLSLFDRPIRRDREFAFLKSANVTIGLSHGWSTDTIHNEEWNAAMENLLTHGLIIGYSGGEVIDCHPLIRTFFGERYRMVPVDWNASHKKLAEYYGHSATPQPENLAQMQPWFRRIRHLCCANEAQVAIDEYCTEVQHSGEEYYLWKTLGAYAENLSVLHGFFEKPWDVPDTTLSPNAKHRVLSDAAMCLEANCRLSDALSALSASLDFAEEEASWGSAQAKTFYSLARCSFGLGHLENALRFANSACDKAAFVTSGAEYCRMGCSFLKAEILATAGRGKEVRGLVDDIRRAIGRKWPGFELFRAVSILRYVNFLIASEEYEELGTIPRIAEALSKSASITIKSYAQLASGKALYAGARNNQSVRTASLALQDAVLLARQGGRNTRLAESLLSLASAKRRNSEVNVARELLDEVNEIAMCGGANPHDWLRPLLLQSFTERFFLANDEKSIGEMRNSLKQIKVLQQEIGGGVYDKEVEMCVRMLDCEQV